MSESLGRRWRDDNAWEGMHHACERDEMVAPSASLHGFLEGWQRQRL
jgi:hypothetical protein